MMKRVLCLLLILLCALPALAEEPGMTVTLASGMSLRNGPGEEFGQSVFNNYPPKAGDQADVLGRCGEWLLLSYTGYWFGQEKQVWSYLHVSHAPEYANTPEMAFDAKPNALGVESTQAYADPEGMVANNWLGYREEGLTVLAVYGDMAYVEGLNPYGSLNRCFIPVSALSNDPTAPALQPAPEGTAVRIASAEIVLDDAPMSSNMEVIALDGGNIALRYDTERSNGRLSWVTAVISPEGKALNRYVLRTLDGDDEHTVEYMLPTKSGYVINRIGGDEDNTVRQTIFTYAGKKKGTDTKRHKTGDLWDTQGTVHYRLSEGLTREAEDAGALTRPVEVRLLHSSGATRFDVGVGDWIHGVLEGDFGLLVPIVGEDNTRLLIFDNRAALSCETVLPCLVYDLQLAPLSDGRVYLLTRSIEGDWQGYILNPADGMVTATGFTLPADPNRDTALLAADGNRLLLAQGGLSTRLLLTDGDQTLLAAEVPGVLVYAESDGETARLLMWQGGKLRLDTWRMDLQ